MVTATVLAVAGLLQGAGFFDAPTEESVKAHNELWGAYFLAAGVIEPDELTYFFQFREFWTVGWNWDNHLSDRALLFGRQSRMDPDCPPVTDRFRLPPTDWINEQRALAWKYTGYLRWRLWWAPPQDRPVIESVLADTEWRIKFLDLAWSAHNGMYSPGRRVALQLIRDQIGRENYLNSRWPDALPPSGYFDHYWVDWGKHK